MSYRQKRWNANGRPVSILLVKLSMSRGTWAATIFNGPGHRGGLQVLLPDAVANRTTYSRIKDSMKAATNAAGAPTQADFHAAISARSDRWYSACLKITRNPDLAADAVQDALLNAWNKRHQFSRSSRLETWIHRIAVNAALSLIRKQRPGVFASPIDDVAADDARVDQIWEEHELESSLASALARLTETERVCFVLKHLEQWRIKEIADELNMNDGRVKQAVFRAVRKLRISMQGLQRQANG